MIRKTAMQTLANTVNRRMYAAGGLMALTLLLLIAPTFSATPPVGADLRLRSAKEPAIIDLNIREEDVLARKAEPLVAAGDDAIKRIGDTTAKEPSRLITIRLTGAALALSDARYKQVLTAGGAQEADRVSTTYEQTLGQYLEAFLDAVRTTAPDVAISVLGLPLETRRGIDPNVANKNYQGVIERVDAFVAAKSIVLSGGTVTERIALRDGLPNALALRDGRPVVYRANGSWRIALNSDALASQPLGSMDAEQQQAAAESGDVPAEGESEFGVIVVDDEAAADDDPFDGPSDADSWSDGSEEDLALLASDTDGHSTGTRNTDNLLYKFHTGNNTPIGRSRSGSSGGGGGGDGGFVLGGGGGGGGSGGGGGGSGGSGHGQDGNGNSGGSGGGSGGGTNTKTDPFVGEGSQDEGWTDFMPSFDSRIIYVSSSTGDDATGQYYSPADPEIGDNPFRPTGTIHPYATLEMAKQIARNGEPDWVLFKRGDTWYGDWPSWSDFSLRDNEPHLLSGYGDGPRPVFIVPNGPSLAIGAPKSNIAIVGLELRGLDEGTPYDGIRLLTEGSNYLIEDCKITNFTNGLNISYAAKTNVKIRRNVICNNFYSGWGAHSQGAFINKIDGLLIEDNIFYRNGYRGNRDDASIFNHNIYLENELDNVTIRGNIICEASSNGISCNGDAVIEDNLVVRNPIGIFARAAPSTVRDNVIIEGTDITPDLLRGWGIVIGDAWYNTGGRAMVEHNIIANKIGAGDLAAIYLEKHKNNGAPEIQATIASNITYNWNGVDFRVESINANDYEDVIVNSNVFDNSRHPRQAVWYSPTTFDLNRFAFSNNWYASGATPSAWFRIGAMYRSLGQWVIDTGEAEAQVWNGEFVDPDRTLGTYHAMLGREATFEAFMTEALKQSKTNWRPEYTAGLINDYFRAGFAEKP